MHTIYKYFFIYIKTTFKVISIHEARQLEIMRNYEIKNCTSYPQIPNFTGVVAEILFYRQPPPPPPTPYWDRALFLSSIILIISPDTQGLRCHPIGTLPGLFLVTRPWYNTLLYIFTILIDISMKGNTCHFTSLHDRPTKFILMVQSKKYVYTFTNYKKNYMHEMQISVY